LSLPLLALLVLLLPPLLLLLLLLLLLAAVIVTCALPVRLVSAADTAVTVTTAGEGTRAGAV
jgi:hypothetical protein